MMNNNSPQGWKECKLGDVIRLIGGGTLKNKYFRVLGWYIPWLSVTDFNTGNKFVYHTDEDYHYGGIE